MIWMATKKSLQGWLIKAATQNCRGEGRDQPRGQASLAWTRNDTGKAGKPAGKLRAMDSVLSEPLSLPQASYEKGRAPGNVAGNPETGGPQAIPTTNRFPSLKCMYIHICIFLNLCLIICFIIYLFIYWFVFYVFVCMIFFIFVCMYI